MRNSINTFRKLFLLSAMLTWVLVPVLAQEEEDEVEYEYSMTMKNVKNPDGSRTLSAELTGESEEGTFPVYQAEIGFYNTLEDSVILLDKVLTNDEGKAELIVPASTNYLKDEEGGITLRAVFEGTDQIDSFEEEVTVKDLNLTMELSEEDGVKTIMVYMNAINADGEEEPVEESDIYFYVQGMINKLPIHDDWLEEGEYEYEFPNNIPGDQDGNLTIFVRVEDSDDFGTVVQQANAKWGSGPIINPAKTRKLWTDMGPEWMIVMMTIVLVLVWANILHGIYNLVKIKKEGRVLKKA